MSNKIGNLLNDLDSKIDCCLNRNKIENGKYVMADGYLVHEGIYRKEFDKKDKAEKYLKKVLKDYELKMKYNPSLDLEKPHMEAGKISVYVQSDSEKDAKEFYKKLIDLADDFRAEYSKLSDNPNYNKELVQAKVNGIERSFKDAINLLKSL